MINEQVIKILSSETSLAAIEELKYYAGFNRDKTRFTSTLYIQPRKLYK